MRRYIFFILSLFLLLPACAQSEHYQARISQFAAMRDIDSTDIVMLGNALTEYAGDWNVLLSWHHVRNRGIAGDDAEGMYRRIRPILNGCPKAIFLMVGGQDIIEGRTVEQAFNASVALIALIRHSSPHTKLFVESNLPIWENNQELLKGKMQMMAQLNVRLRHYCEKHHIAYINLFRSFVRRGTNEMRRELTQDGFLLTPFGYKLWAFEIKKYLFSF
jgi:lysophospholipase L1-like esterase